MLEHERVLAASPAARAAGIQPGMRRGGVLMLMPEARIVERSPEREAEALHAVAMALLQYTPQVAQAEESTLLIDIGASLRLFGGIRALCRRVRASLRALGYSGSTRSALAPDVPTIAEAGVKGYDVGYWFAAYAPAKTPPPLVARLNELLSRAAKSPTAHSGFYAMSGTSIFLTSPEELTRFQLAEAKKWGEIIRKAGIEKE